MIVLGALVCLLTNGCSCVFYSNDGEYAYAVTAAHCVKPNDVVTASYDGKQFGCRVIDVDTDRDVAVIKCDMKHVGDVSCPVVSVDRGSLVVLVGFPSGNLTKGTGILTDATIFKGDETKQVVAMSPPVSPGFSGGGVFTESGLVGVVTHSTPVGGACTILDRIVDRGVDRTASKVTGTLDDATTFSLRDFILAVIGWLSRYYFPGANMVKTQVVRQPMQA